MTKFTFTREENQFNDTTKSTVEFSAESLDEILQQFQFFLKGAGFYFDGDIVIDQPCHSIDEANFECNNVSLYGMDVDLGHHYDAN